MLKIEISADSAGELITHISDLAQQFGSAPAAGAAPAADKPRRTRKAAEPETASEAAQQPAEKAEQPAETAGEAPRKEPLPEKPAETKSEQPAETKAEPEQKPAKKLTIDDVRDYVINDYLNACIEKQQDRTDAFQNLLKHFGVTKFKEIPDERLQEVKDHVAGLIEKAAKS